MDQVGAVDRRGRVLAWVAAGGRLGALGQDGERPSRAEVAALVAADPDFASAFRAARVAGNEALAEECLEIADAPVASSLELAHRRLRIESRMKLMARWERLAERETAVAAKRDAGRRETARKAEVRADLAYLKELNDELDWLEAIEAQRRAQPADGRPPAPTLRPAPANRPAEAAMAARSAPAAAPRAPAAPSRDAARPHRPGAPPPRQPHHPAFRAAASTARAPHEPNRYPPGVPEAPG